LNSNLATVGCDPMSRSISEPGHKASLVDGEPVVRIPTLRG
jgi:hypothetical protein